MIKPVKTVKIEFLTGQNILKHCNTLLFQFKIKINALHIFRMTT